MEQAAAGFLQSQLACLLPLLHGIAMHPSFYWNSCCVSSWERISDRNISPKIKVGANYINGRMAQQEATINGYDSALFLNRMGTMAEGLRALYGARCKLITPSTSESVLKSITRRTILELSVSHLGCTVEERPIGQNWSYVCDEAFMRFCSRAHPNHLYRWLHSWSRHPA